MTVLIENFNSLCEFLLFPDHDHNDLIFINTQFLTYRLEEKNRFALYALYKFFVEIEYSVESN